MVDIEEGEGEDQEEGEEEEEEDEMYFLNKEMKTIQPFLLYFDGVTHKSERVWIESEGGNCGCDHSLLVRLDLIST